MTTLLQRHTVEAPTQNGDDNRHGYFIGRARGRGDESSIERQGDTLLVRFFPTTPALVPPVRDLRPPVVAAAAADPGPAAREALRRYAAARDELAGLQHRRAQLDAGFEAAKARRRAVELGAVPPPAGGIAEALLDCDRAAKETATEALAAQQRIDILTPGVAELRQAVLAALWRPLQAAFQAETEELSRTVRACIDKINESETGRLLYQWLESAQTLALAHRAAQGLDGLAEQVLAKLLAEASA